MGEGWIVREGRAVAGAEGVRVRFGADCGGAGAGGCVGCIRNRDMEVDGARLSVGRHLRGGERVELALARHSLTRVALACFALPLATLVAGAAAGQGLAMALSLPPDPLSATGGVAALATALGVTVRRGEALTRALELRARVCDDARTPTRTPR